MLRWLKIIKYRLGFETSFRPTEDEGKIVDTETGDEWAPEVLAGQKGTVSIKKLEKKSKKEFKKMVKKRLKELR